MPKRRVNKKKKAMVIESDEEAEEVIYRDGKWKKCKTKKKLNLRGRDMIELETDAAQCVDPQWQNEPKDSEIIDNCSQSKGDDEDEGEDEDDDDEMQMQMLMDMQGEQIMKQLNTEGGIVDNLVSTQAIKSKSLNPKFWLVANRDVPDPGTVLFRLDDGIDTSDNPVARGNANMALFSHRFNGKERAIIPNPIGTFLTRSYKGISSNAKFNVYEDRVEIVSSEPILEGAPIKVYAGKNMLDRWINGVWTDPFIDDGPVDQEEDADADANANVDVDENALLRANPQAITDTEFELVAASNLQTDQRIYQYERNFVTDPKKVSEMWNSLFHLDYFYHIFEGKPRIAEPKQISVHLNKEFSMSKSNARYVVYRDKIDIVATKAIPEGVKISVYSGPGVSYRYIGERKWEYYYRKRGINLYTYRSPQDVYYRHEAIKDGCTDNFCYFKCDCANYDTVCTSDLCSCTPKTCNNRPFEKPFPKTYTKGSDVEGTGLFAGQDIPIGRWVIEYIGEVLSTSEYEYRSQYYAKTNCNFVATSNYNFIIDSSRSGNIARFSNHSCNPNATAKDVIDNNGIVRIVLRAKKHISKDREIVWDYNEIVDTERELIACRCNSSKCRKTMNRVLAGKEKKERDDRFLKIDKERRSILDRDIIANIGMYHEEAKVQGPMQAPLVEEGGETISGKFMMGHADLMTEYSTAMAMTRVPPTSVAQFKAKASQVVYINIDVEGMEFEEETNPPIREDALGQMEEDQHERDKQEPCNQQSPKKRKGAKTDTPSKKCKKKEEDRKASGSSDAKKPTVRRLACDSFERAKASGPEAGSVPSGTTGAGPCKVRDGGLPPVVRTDTSIQPDQSPARSECDVVNLIDRCLSSKITPATSITFERTPCSTTTLTEETREREMSTQAAPACVGDSSSTASLTSSTSSNSGGGKAEQSLVPYNSPVIGRVKRITPTRLDPDKVKVKVKAKAEIMPQQIPEREVDRMEDIIRKVQDAAQAQAQAQARAEARAQAQKMKNPKKAGKLKNLKNLKTKENDLSSEPPQTEAPPRMSVEGTSSTVDLGEQPAISIEPAEWDCNASLPDERSDEFTELLIEFPENPPPDVVLEQLNGDLEVRAEELVDNGNLEGRDVPVENMYMLPVEPSPEQIENSSAGVAQHLLTSPEFERPRPSGVHIVELVATPGQIQAIQEADRDGDKTRLKEYKGATRMIHYTKTKSPRKRTDEEFLEHILITSAPIDTNMSKEKEASPQSAPVSVLRPGILTQNLEASSVCPVQAQVSGIVPPNTPSQPIPALTEPNFLEMRDCSLTPLSRSPLLIGSYPMTPPAYPSPLKLGSLTPCIGNLNHCRPASRGAPPPPSPPPNPPPSPLPTSASAQNIPSINAQTRIAGLRNRTSVTTPFSLSGVACRATKAVKRRIFPSAPGMSSMTGTGTKELYLENYADEVEEGHYNGTQCIPPMQGDSLKENQKEEIDISSTANTNLSVMSGEASTTSRRRSDSPPGVIHGRMCDDSGRPPPPWGVTADPYNGGEIPGPRRGSDGVGVGLGVGGSPGPPYGDPAQEKQQARNPKPRMYHHTAAMIGHIMHPHEPPSSTIQSAVRGAVVDSGRDPGATDMHHFAQVASTMSTLGDASKKDADAYRAISEVQNNTMKLHLDGEMATMRANLEKEKVYSEAQVSREKLDLERLKMQIDQSLADQRFQRDRMEHAKHMQQLELQVKTVEAKEAAQRQQAEMLRIENNLKLLELDQAREKMVSGKKYTFIFTREEGTRLVPSNEPCNPEDRIRFDDIWRTNDNLLSGSAWEDYARKMTSLKVVTNPIDFRQYIDKLIRKTQWRSDTSVMKRRITMLDTLKKDSGVYLFQTGPAASYSFYVWAGQHQKAGPTLERMYGNPRYVVHRANGSLYTSDLWEPILYTQMFPVDMPYISQHFEMDQGIDSCGVVYNGVSTPARGTAPVYMSVPLMDLGRMPGLDINDIKTVWFEVPRVKENAFQKYYQMDDAMRQASYPEGAMMTLSTAAGSDPTSVFVAVSGLVRYHQGEMEVDHQTMTWAVSTAGDIVLDMTEGMISVIDYRAAEAVYGTIFPDYIISPDQMTRIESILLRHPVEQEEREQAATLEEIETMRCVFEGNAVNIETAVTVYGMRLSRHIFKDEPMIAIAEMLSFVNRINVQFDTTVLPVLAKKMEKITSLAFRYLGLKVEVDGDNLLRRLPNFQDVFKHRIAAIYPPLKDLLLTHRYVRYLTALHHEMGLEGVEFKRAQDEMLPLMEDTYTDPLSPAKYNVQSALDNFESDDQAILALQGIMFDEITVSLADIDDKLVVGEIIDPVALARIRTLQESILSLEKNKRDTLMNKLSVLRRLSRSNVVDKQISETSGRKELVLEQIGSISVRINDINDQRKHMIDELLDKRIPPSLPAVNPPRMPDYIPRQSYMYSIYQEPSEDHRPVYFPAPPSRHYRRRTSPSQQPFYGGRDNFMQQPPNRPPPDYGEQSTEDVKMVIVSVPGPHIQYRPIGENLRRHAIRTIFGMDPALYPRTNYAIGFSPMLIHQPEQIRIAQPVIGDGNCFYRALSKTFFGLESDRLQQVIRIKIGTEVKRQKAQLDTLLLDNLGSGQNILVNREWADEYVLMASSLILGVKIYTHVKEDNSTGWAMPPVLNYNQPHPFTNMPWPEESIYIDHIDRAHYKPVHAGIKVPTDTVITQSKAKHPRVKDLPVPSLTVGKTLYIDGGLARNILMAALVDKTLEYTNLCNTTDHNRNINATRHMPGFKQHFINYFKKYIDLTATFRTLTFSRVKSSPTPQWEAATRNAININNGVEMVMRDPANNTGRIQDDQRPGVLMVDFANKSIGGGTLRGGAVQEELLFLTHPELILSKLFMPTAMQSDEAVVITGSIKMSDYTYAIDRKVLPKELFNPPSQPIMTNVVAIDALNFGNKPATQYNKRAINRELTKAYAGFNQEGYTHIRTGNWGSGAFGGDNRLKLIIQLLACTVANKKMIYCCFEQADDTRLRPVLRYCDGKTVAAVYNNITAINSKGDLDHLLEISGSGY